MNSTTPLKPRPAPGQQGSTPFRSASANRFRSSLVPMNRSSPARTSRVASKLSTVSTTSNASYGRDLFRTSTPQSTRTTKFAPSLPVEVTTTTPSARKFVAKATRSGLSSITSAEPFKMRIPSPDPELSGEALSKEVPADPNRAGTIYADQFLAHKCPPNFDDLQRRQFFCILDLRRLKYAANEIFTKKDWKLNIMNFAKEYEKSRGLIMLRYGLYEFKNIKPSEEVMKKWRATHNLPDPEPESVAAATPVQNRRSGFPGTASKRKAEDDVTPKDNALMTSTANQNKRRNTTHETVDPALKGPAPFKKSKRKAEETDEPDENQPNKIQRPPPSAAKSKFESILDRAQSGSTSPIKRPALPAFGTPKSIGSQNANPFAASTNGFKPTPAGKENNSTGSVLSEQPVGSTPTKKTSNIFSYLSESSANSSGNENGVADEDDTESEPEDDSGSLEASASNQPSAAASDSADTPPTQSTTSLFSGNKSTPVPNPFGSVTQSSDVSSKGGLFGRVQMGSNGQPLRATEEQNPFGSAKQPSPEKEQNRTHAKRPGDYTFNAATTPISFGKPASQVTQTPATAPKEISKPENTSAPNLSQSLFGASAPASSTPKQTASSLFGASSSASVSSKPNSAATSLFSGPKSTPAPPSLFGSTPNKTFGNAEKATVTDFSAPKKEPKDVSDADSKSAKVIPEADKEAPSVPKEPAKAPTPLFGASTTNGSATPQVKSLFGANGGENKSSVFGNFGKTSTSSLFGASPARTPASTNGAQANGFGVEKPVFETPGKSPAPSFIFGGSKPDTANEVNKPSNGISQEQTTPAATTPKPIFGSEGFKPATPAGASIFGAKSTPALSTNIFGAKSNDEAPAEKKPAATPASSLFGNNPNAPTGVFGATPAEKKDQPATTQAPSIFSSTPAKAAPIFAFGGSGTPGATTNTQAPSTPSMIFGASTPAAQPNGGGFQKPDFQFGGSSTPVTGSASFTFGQGASNSTSNSGSGSGFTFTAGGNGQSFNNPFSSGTTPSTPVFSTNNPSTPNPSSSFGLSFGQQAPSTPNPAPASQTTPLFGASNAGNGGPSFSFTQATPSQNSPNPFAPTPTGSFLQASGDGSNRATSPFPAPSSIGTTPVNGTPEPQTQGDDSEGASHEQISLTNGGPGEEDEIVLHEVRAKAIKYIPIVPGEDEEERKSPWSTQGVGPLRVLKNMSTGTVRVLLRAEPRGHIAMNKALLADIRYEVTDKAVKFPAAKDDGSGIETWLLQVKKPEFAQQLSNALESNKVANKK